jgi:hypothetical protein
MYGSPVHLRLGRAALCGVAGPMAGTRDPSVVTCEVCRALIHASGLVGGGASAAEPWSTVVRQRAEARDGSTYTAGSPSAPAGGR